MIDIEIQISISERSSCWAINYTEPCWHPVNIAAVERIKSPNNRPWMISSHGKILRSYLEWFQAMMRSWDPKISNHCEIIHWMISNHDEILRLYLGGRKKFAPIHSRGFQTFPHSWTNDSSNASATLSTQWSPFFLNQWQNPTKIRRTFES